MVLAVTIIFLIRAFRLTTGAECDARAQCTGLPSPRLSPINIDTNGTVCKPFPPLVVQEHGQERGYEWQPCSNLEFKKEGNGKVKIDTSSCDVTVRGGGLIGEYDVNVIVFHTYGSEHTINGKHFPMELREFRSLMAYDPDYTTTLKDMLPLQDINGRSTYEACDQDKFCNLANGNEDTNLDNASKMCDYLLKGRISENCGSAKLHLEQNSVRIGLKTCGFELIDGLLTEDFYSVLHMDLITKIEDQRQSMELHIVSKNGNPNAPECIQFTNLVFVFELTDEDNSKWTFLIDSLDQAKRDGSVVDLETFSLRSLLPDNMHDFTSSFGNRHDPLYSESARWLVFASPIGISESQMNKTSSVLE